MSTLTFILLLIFLPLLQIPTSTPYPSPFQPLNSATFQDFLIQMKDCISESTKLDRKTVERNRRIHMKGLCFKLFSLIPKHHYKTYKDSMTQQDQLDEAANYITQMKDRIDELQKKKEKAMELNPKRTEGRETNMETLGVKLPVLELRGFDSSIEVSVISGVDKNFMFYEVISILEDEGAEVVTTNISNIGDKIFYTLHAQVKISRVGVETSRVSERLNELIFSKNYKS